MVRDHNGKEPQWMTTTVRDHNGATTMVRDHNLPNSIVYQTKHILSTSVGWQVTTLASDHNGATTMVNDHNGYKNICKGPQW